MTGLSTLAGTGAILSLLAMPGHRSGGDHAPPPHTRTYYVAADTVTWDYAPGPEINLITGQPYDSVARILVGEDSVNIGHRYLKAIFREYTDSTFTTLKPRDAAWEHLGILGPLLRAVVGDTIRVVFRNNTPRPATMHPHGVFYTKANEGSPYADSTSGADKADDAVPPGGTHTYVWPVPERAGPGPGDGSSIMWMYHSHSNDERDVDAGLVGPIIVTARNMARADGTPKDVDREFVVAFAEFDESQSWYLGENIRRYAPKEQIVKSPFGEDAGIPHPEGNFKESMNGYLYGHLPGLTMRVGERVRWYLMATTGFEIHSPHWHGNTVLIGRMRTDVTALLPMGMVTADMVPDDPGTWLFHCHNGPHLIMGMQALYHVVPR
ncbi:MAG TPA: multicopper oxidase domain-containing protein [Gemmatimonadales bacterium]|nr:multicopper oxidase domain-containing protein [Gemmatimonadales bacterium]